MSTIYISGHKHPDFDSVAAAFVYAHLKSRIDPENHYIPIRCGNLNHQTKTVFDKLNIEAPVYRSDLRTLVSDVVNRDVPRLELSDPLQTAIGILDETGISILPVFDSEGNYRGSLSSIEVSHLLMRETFGVRPIYRFRNENLAKVVPGRMLMQGEDEEFDAPIMIGAMPFERSVERIASLDSNRPLLIIGLRRDLLQCAIDQNFPAVILTGATEKEVAEIDFSGYGGAVYLSDVDTAETVRLLRFSTPIETIINTDAQHIDIQMDFNKAKSLLSDSGMRGLPVFDANQFVGIVSRGSFLDRPRNKLILVDHNELEQSIHGAGDCDILEIIDHHRVGSVMSREPFSLFTRPVGCTCTIIRQFYRQHGVAVPTEIALIMLSAILSDTIMLKSPTTTDDDRQTVEGLSRHAGVDWRQWGQQMFASGPRLANISPEDAVKGDFKSYEIGNYRFGIGQVEVQSLSDLEEVITGYLNFLEKLRIADKLDAAMLLITDVIAEDSVLIVAGMQDEMQELHYEELKPSIFNLPGILSRKKQVLPEILRVLE